MNKEKINNYGATFKSSPAFYITTRLVVLFFIIIIIFPEIALWLPQQMIQPLK